MEDVYEWKGLNGQLVTFKKEVGDAEKITFIINMQEYHNFCKLWMNCKLGMLSFFN